MEQDDWGVDVKGQPAKAGHQGGAWIRYRTEFRNRVTEELLASRETEALSVPEISITDEDTEEPVFELVTTYYTRLLESARPSEERTRHLVTTPLAKPRYCMNIFSRSIANALQSVVKYYPSQSLSADPIVVQWPYPVLVHHYDELSDFRNAAAAKDTKDLCLMERDAAKHLSLLLQFLDEHVMEGARAEQERNKRGLFTWEYAWLHYRPGRTNLAKNRGEDDWWATVHHSISGGVFEDPPVNWNIFEWSMVYDGTFLGRRMRTVTYVKFDGELEIDRHVIDVTDIDEDNLERLPERAQAQIEYGRQYWKLLRKQCRQHKGKSRDFPYNEVSDNTFFKF